jgi:hypothetical protein
LVALFVIEVVKAERRIRARDGEDVGDGEGERHFGA